MSDLDTIRDENALLAHAIVDTVRDPLLVLDPDLRVVAASRSFYRKFQFTRDAVVGRLLGDIGKNEWDIAPLHAVLSRVGPDNSVMEDYEVGLSFAHLGRRTFLLNARRLFFEDNRASTVLLAFEDITERRLLEQERDELLRQKDLLMAEMQHRIANSLTIIASILMLKARTVPSPETRAHLEDAHRRVLSVAAVQQHLHPAQVGQSIHMGHYLTELCASLAGSMINDDKCSIHVKAGDGTATSTAAVSLGLITTELVINALKHAFPPGKSGCVINVTYQANEEDWRLLVADNGVGAPADAWPPATQGLGTSIVIALAEQLQARMDTKSDANGTSVSVTHSNFRPRSSG